MNVLIEDDGKTYKVLAISAPHEFAHPFPGTQFVCMIWDHDGHFTDAQRSEVAERLIQGGCKYAICGGQNCEAWHDAVDEQIVGRQVDDADPTNDALDVMTTWHDGQTPDDVAFFFVTCTDFGYYDFKHYLVLHVGDGETIEEVNAAVRWHAIVKGRI